MTKTFIEILIVKLVVDGLLDVVKIVTDRLI